MKDVTKQTQPEVLLWKHKHSVHPVMWSPGERQADWWSHDWINRMFVFHSNSSGWVCFVTFINEKVSFKQGQDVLKIAVQCIYFGPLVHCIDRNLYWLVLHSWDKRFELHMLLKLLCSVWSMEHMQNIVDRKFKKKIRWYSGLCEYSGLFWSVIDNWNLEKSAGDHSDSVNFGQFYDSVTMSTNNFIKSVGKLWDFYLVF